MAKKKKADPLTDWYGNPILGAGFGLPDSGYQITFRGEIDYDGKRYIRAYTSGGVPGDRLPIENCYKVITDESGKVLYDSRLPPPPDAKLLLTYIGYRREKMLKRYFPG
jgi:hypothetical protein